MSTTPEHLQQQFQSQREWIPQAWAYQDHGATRDLRLDLMRGFVIPLLFASHFDFFSALMYIGWERIGVVSTAEIFVILAGIVVGMVYGKRVKADGLSAALPKIMDRAVELYRASVLMILAVALIRYVPQIDATIITTFFSPYENKTYPLYPPLEAGFATLVSKALLLQISPHQFQIVGMYVAMFILFTPAAFFLLARGRWKLLMAISWGLYLINSGAPESLRPLNMQYEYAFPTLAWQLVYVHGMMVGYYKKEIISFFETNPGKWVIYVCIALSVLFALFSWNHPMREFSNMRLHIIPNDTFHYLYNTYFQKNTLGIARLINATVLFIAIYAILTRCWQPINRALGWYLIPLGQASLYVFIMHIPLLLLVYNTPFPGYKDFWVNTLLHLLILAVIWIMVKKEFLFRWIPR